MRAPILFNPALGFPGRVYNLFLNYIRNSSFPVEYVNVYAEGKAIEKLPHWEVLVEECINNATKAVRTVTCFQDVQFITSVLYLFSGCINLGRSFVKRLCILYKICA